MSAAIASGTVPREPARAAARRILRDVEDLRVALHRAEHGLRICTGALCHIDHLLTPGRKEGIQPKLAREMAQAALADARRLAPETQA